MSATAPGSAPFDVTIVGAGPVGLFGAYYAGLRGLRVAVVESLPEVGGQLNALYPEKPIYDVAGFEAVSGRELVDRLRRQASAFDPTYVLGEQVESLTRSRDGFIVVTSSGAAFSTRTVVITAGIGSFTPRPMAALAEFLGRGVSHYVPDLEEHRDLDVIVVGGGDSACDWALALEPLARSVSLIHRRDTFSAHQHTVDTLARSSVQVLTSAEVLGVVGESVLAGLRVRRADGTTAIVRADRVVAALGFTANLGPIKDWGLTLVNQRYIAVDTTMATSLRGVFAAGDVNDYRGKVRLIAVGFGEVATAVNNAAVQIDPQQPLFPGHSTDSSPRALESVAR